MKKISLAKIRESLSSRLPEMPKTEQIRSLLSKLPKPGNSAPTQETAPPPEPSQPGVIRSLLDKLPKSKTQEPIEQIDAELEQINQRRIKKFFHRFLQKAKPEDVKKIDLNLEKMNRGKVAAIWSQVQALAQMIKDPGAAWKSKALGIAALIYLISPLDAIPDVLPVVGLADDVALIAVVVSTLANELEQYLVRQAEKKVEIEVRKYNKIVRISLLGSIAAAILAILVKFILKNM